MPISLRYLWLQRKILLILKNSGIWHGAVWQVGPYRIRCAAEYSNIYSVLQELVWDWRRAFAMKGLWLTTSLWSHNFENTLLIFLLTKLSFVSPKFTILTYEGVQTNVRRRRSVGEHKRKNLVLPLQWRDRVCNIERGRTDKFCLHLNRKWTGKDILIK